ncbi:zinc-binding dehydrogenase [Streptomyces sp. MK37H]|uniref:zinc-binding dehydrogenase n=1 Tax=Streptomyces sp. MK37H TaxID=2699117 RepID=UPI001B38DFC8|nr:zinc-binding dehydrogenase [Streptomyces sp. MK37H]
MPRSGRACRRGADDYRLSTDPAIFTDFAGAFDLVLSTVPADLDYDAFLGLLALDGTFVNLGVPKKPLSLDVFSLLHNRRSLAGTLVGSIDETQEMLDFCARNGITAEVEVITADEIDAAFDRVAAIDVRDRIVSSRTATTKRVIDAVKLGELRGVPAEEVYLQDRSRRDVSMPLVMFELRSGDRTVVVSRLVPEAVPLSPPRRSGDRDALLRALLVGSRHDDRVLGTAPLQRPGCGGRPGRTAQVGGPEPGPVRRLPQPVTVRAAGGSVHGAGVLPL